MEKRIVNKSKQGIRSYSSEDFVIIDEERICQMVVARNETAKLVCVDYLKESNRGDEGFGHTGKK